MLHNLHFLIYSIMLSPLFGAIISGVFGGIISNRLAHRVTILAMTITTALSIILATQIIGPNIHYSFNAYHWLDSGSFSFHVGFLLDTLTAVMLVTVSAVSLLVHIYSVGYMDGDPGYKRFFSYMSLFTFFMLMLASANNFMQLFFGWEGVGLVSYLLIGFWFTKTSAASGSLKAFIVNRIGDFGLMIGIALLFAHVGSLDYSTIFAASKNLSMQTISIIPGHPWSLITVSCIFLFIGAMGKSAQFPLHIWLPESMEGPTPISALIHAATMVTAGIFMVARMAPLYNYSPTALSVVLIIGATGALFLGLLAVVENDIKRVIAYSTMSQLGYMMAANGVAAYQVAIFHLMTHACFKALLFLAAGSVILAMHHEQDLRKMGGLRKYLPQTCILFLIGSLALAAMPPFSGFYSKDAIIDAVAQSHLFGAHYAYYCLLLGAFVTSWYIFRAFFMAFCGKERMTDKVREHLVEPSWVVRLPLYALAIPSVILGAILIYPFIYHHPSLFSASLNIPTTKVWMPDSATGVVWLQLIIHSFSRPPFWFAISGVIYAYLRYQLGLNFPRSWNKFFILPQKILQQQYGIDSFNDFIFVRPIRRVSNFFYKTADLKIIDQTIVHGTGNGIQRLSGWLRCLQSGYLYQYVLVMLIGVLIFLLWLFICR